MSTNLQAKPSRSNHHNKRHNRPGFVGVTCITPSTYVTAIHIHQKLYNLPVLSNPQHAAFLYDALCMGFSDGVPPTGTVISVREQ
jgi:hypothetical protein